MTGSCPAGCGRPGKKGHAEGFTLIEVAFVLAIIGILATAGAELLPLLVKQNKIIECRSRVEVARAAVLGFALANGRLPRASNTAGGVESSAASPVYQGYLPFRTLGIPGADPYTRTLFYAVDRNLTSTGSKLALQNQLGNVINPALAPNPSLYANGTFIQASFVVISGGQNGRANSRNDDNNNRIIDASDNNQFENPDAPPTANYDDTMTVESLAQLLGYLGAIP